MLKYIWIVFKKEMKDTFRDRKTIFTSIIIPILIFPILSLALGSGASEIIEEGAKPIDIAVISENDNGLLKYLNAHQGINIINTDEPEKSLEKLEVKAIVKIDKYFDEKVNKGEFGTVEIMYDESSQKSSMAYPKLKSIINDYSKIIVSKRLKELGADNNILKVVDIKAISVAKEDGFGIIMFSMMLPMFLTIWSAVGGIPAATDLGAGEKERQTLEPLLTTKVNRISLLIGKYFTVVVAGIIATLASLTGFIIATKLKADLFGTISTLPINTILIIGLFCIGLTLTFSSLELAISFYARNFKEAQTYLTPVTIIMLIPAYLTMYLDGKAIPDAYFHIPVINVISIIKEALVSIYNPVHIGVVLIWVIIYISIALMVTVKMFNKETVIFRN
ncbi:ABC transporter permease [Caloranaerobacter azorensis]|uniref:ABC transporter permease n=1 Tax=Caloranaerobacter azorensis TaxID=116090 RepID=A0A6P1YCW5_9FIRM|nr:ABC transporter permease [Caloranaerobacter azorensis]QIB27169.1 ABC transporter permease [Caloranaerobacter azorensis]